ncbi:isoleucine--tRNA ligase [Trifolium repens]|nr:isoleucine--tRNA ligase [Trifolium repens]
MLKPLKNLISTPLSRFECSGVWADWNNPYLTVDLEYEATQAISTEGGNLFTRVPRHRQHLLKLSFSTLKVMFQEAYMPFSELQVLL